MKILYDHQIFTIQNYGGISRYFYEFNKELIKLDGIVSSTSFLLSDNYYLMNKKKSKHIDFLHLNFKGKKKIYNLINRNRTILKLKQNDYDVFHPTYYDPYFLSYLNGKPFVLTVHDMIHEKFKNFFKRYDKTMERKRLLIEKSSKIIAVSERTKKDLIKIFGINESKVEVVYHGNSMFPPSNPVIDMKVPKRYIFYVGTRSNYKNFIRFIKSIYKLLNKDKTLTVVCAGGGRFSSQEVKFMKEINIQNQVYQFNLDDTALAYFYSNALIFVFPSLYEGFGIPILESFACKCPLVCSNTGALPEIANNAAYYFDPYSEESIKNAIELVIEDKNLQSKLVQKGTERLSFFSWKRTALETKKIYESILF